MVFPVVRFPAVCILRLLLSIKLSANSNKVIWRGFSTRLKSMSSRFRNSTLDGAFPLSLKKRLKRSSTSNFIDISSWLRSRYPKWDDLKNLPEFLSNLLFDQFLGITLQWVGKTILLPLTVMWHCMAVSVFDFGSRSWYATDNLSKLTNLLTNICYQI